MSRIAEDVGFVHLRVHSAFSLLEGALPLKDVVKLAAADRMPAIGVSDSGNLFGALEFCQTSAEAGVQPIVGCQVAFDFGHMAETGRTAGGTQIGRLCDIVLIAATEAGYWNLVRLVSASFMDTDGHDRPHLSIRQLAEASDGLIALTGGPGGPVDQALAVGQADVAAARLDQLANLFPDTLYIELQRHGAPEERFVEPQLVDLAYARGLPLVATNEVFFPARDDYEAHDALICIAEGAVIGDDNRRRLTPEHYFKTRTEMIELFADLPEAVANTVEIAMRVGYWPTTRKPILPRFVDKDDDAEAAEAGLLREEAGKGLERRLATHGLGPGLSEDDYRNRLDYELDVIERMKYPGYFLIVADFIQWAKAQGIPVGPGRGSGAGSVVAWSLTITDLDPLRFSLLFERFLNPDRVSMPDFDVDFCQNRRDEVIRYVQQKYGVDHVAQIITFGSLQARACLRDVGRVLQMPYGQVDRIAKMVPQNPANPVTLGQAI
ncbi:MAG: DNA polymerase III subunit alpha, partial [Hyphomicrobiales bacterium]|nr:DNA polymerase III subunit alpha [Hyphomicrobiales bacterium]